MRRLHFPRILSANILKLLAVLAMTADHLAWLFFTGYPTDFLPILLHLMGRITCPIMCYFVAEGFYYTRNVRRYTHRLFLFALLSHGPFRFFSADYRGLTSLIPFYGGSVMNQTGVIWSLAWGLVMLRVYYNKNLHDAERALLLVLCAIAAIPADWSCIGSFCVLLIGINRNLPKKQLAGCTGCLLTYVMIYIVAIDRVYGLLQLGVFLSVPLLMLYNWKRGSNPTVNRVMKWFFYLYYPVHLLLLGLVRQYGL